MILLAEAHVLVLSEVGAVGKRQKTWSPCLF